MCDNCDVHSPLLKYDNNNLNTRSTINLDWKVDFQFCSELLLMSRLARLMC
jgi:hypothetical protein